MARESRWWNMTLSLSLGEATQMVDGIELVYRIGGSGPPLGLLHGFTLTGEEWNPFLDELGKHNTVIVPDLPGMGHSARPMGDFTHRKPPGSCSGSSMPWEQIVCEASDIAREASY